MIKDANGSMIMRELIDLDCIQWTNNTTMKSIKLLLITAILLVPTTIDSSPIKSAPREIKRVITIGYIEGVFLKGDMDLIREKWHSDCDIVYYDPVDRILQKGSAIQYFESYFKKNPGPMNPDISYEFKSIQVAGYAAIATVEISNKDKTRKIYTDYLSLYRFKSGWKIVSKTFYAFPPDR